MIVMCIRYDGYKIVEYRYPYLSTCRTSTHKKNKKGIAHVMLYLSMDPGSLILEVKNALEIYLPSPVDISTIHIDLTRICRTTLDAIDHCIEHHEPNSHPAVRYSDECIKTPPPTQKEHDLDNQLKRIRKKLKDLNKDYWAGDAAFNNSLAQRPGFVTCDHCESELNAEYCGKLTGTHSNKHGWHNHCPVCGADVRPQHVLDEIAALNAEYLPLFDLKERLRDERNKKLRLLVLVNDEGGVRNARVQYMD